MNFGFRWISQLGPAGFVLEAIFAALIGIGLLLAFILGRRAWRRHVFRRRDRRVLAIRQLWPQILSGEVPAQQWRLDALDCEIVETILLDTLDSTPPGETTPFEELLRRSGLLDLRAHQARTTRGWRRRSALIALGRMRLPEAIPVLTEALDARDTATRVAAVRSLGRLSLPEAAVPMLERLLRDELKIPATSLQNALISCLRWKPRVLLPYLQKSQGATRTLLARVLSEVATSELGEELVVLAQDPLPEVRACAARALAEAPRPLALSALGLLAGDREWFVRLRAVAALGQLHDAQAIPTLVELLCDRNRYVRLRAAMALSRLTAHLETILSLVQQKRDRYALQALLSELQRGGVILELVGQLLQPEQRAMAEAILLAVMRAGAHRLLLSAMLHHRVGRVRTALARLLAKSGELSLLAPLREAVAEAPSRRQRKIANWVLQRLQQSPESRSSMVPVPA